MNFLKNIYAVMAIAWMFILGPIAFVILSKVLHLENFYSSLEKNWVGGLIVLASFFFFHFGGFAFLIWLAERK